MTILKLKTENTIMSTKHNGLQKLIPKSFIHRFNNLLNTTTLTTTTTTTTTNMICYKVFMENILGAYLNPIGCPTENENLCLTLNYIKRVQARRKFIKVILNRLIYPEVLIKQISSYIGIETVSDHITIFNKLE